MLGGLLPRLLAWGADAKLGVAMRRERQVRAIKHDWSRSGRDWRIRSRSSTWQSERTKRQRAQHAWGSMWSLDTAGKPFMMFTTDRHGRLSEKDRATLEKVRTVAVVVVVAAPPCHRCVFRRRACAGMRASHAHAEPFSFLIWQVRAHVKEQQRAESETPVKHALLTPRSSDAANRCAPHAMHHETAPRARRVAYLAPYISAISRPYLRAGRDHRSVRAARRAFLRPRAAEAQLGARFSTHLR